MTTKAAQTAQPADETFPPPPPTPIGKAKKKRTPTNESKREKFLRLARHRVRMAEKRLEQIGHLGASNYEVHDDDRKKIFDWIDRAVAEMKIKLAARKAKPEFDL